MNFLWLQKITISWLFIFFWGIFILGCGNKEDHGSQDPVIKAYQLIDEHRTDEAITLLENELSDNPDNYQYKVVLASAYAQKAGIKIQKLIPLVKQFDGFKKANAASTSKNKKKSYSEQVNESVINTSIMLNTFANTLATYAAIPLLTAEQAVYLRYTIYLLNSVDNKDLNPEDVTYRAILEVILLKHNISEKLVGEFMEPAVKDEVHCRIDIGTLNDSIIEAGKLLIDIYNDIGFSNPKQAKKMQQLSQDTSEVISNISLATTALTVLDEVSMSFLKQSLIGYGFGKTIKCGSQ